MMQKRIQNRSIQVGLRNQPEDGHPIVGDFIIQYGIQLDSI